MSKSHERAKWVKYNPLTATYDTPDGTSVAAEVVDSVQCLADVLHIAQIRADTRAAAKLAAAMNTPKVEVKTYGVERSFDSEGDMYEAITGRRPSTEG
jgi:phage terminase large subunit-like protein